MSKPERSPLVRALRHRPAWQLALGLLLLAWVAFAAGRICVANLDWAGYDPDPDISQSLMNDARVARTLLPFLAVAVGLDLAAVVMASNGLDRVGARAVSGLIMLLGLGSAAWHGYGLVVSLFFTGLSQPHRI